MPTDEDYGLTSAFERAVVWRACCDPKFYAQIGRHLDPSKLRLDVSQLLVQAAHAVFAETGLAPSSTTIVLQRLQDLHEAGELEHGAILEADEYLELAEIDDASADQLASIMRPKIQDAHAREATREAIQASDPSQYARIAKSFERAATIGTVEEDHGWVFRPDDYTNIAALARGDRLGFDLFELEEITNGGLKKGMVGMLCAPSGHGKTTGLCHIGTVAWKQGITVAYATLELAVGQIEAKFRSGLTSMPLNTLISDPRAQAQCTQRILEMQGLGGLAIKKFPARKTYWSHVVDWFEELEESALSERPQLLIVDFLSKLGCPDKNKNKYTSDGEIMDKMHDYAEDEEIWLWTASQPRRTNDKSKRKVIDNDDMNESQGKIEGSDLFISMNPRGDGKEIYYWVGKHRAGPSQIGCGPFPHDFAYGRIVPPGYQASEAPAGEVVDLFG